MQSPVQHSSALERALQRLFTARPAVVVDRRPVALLSRSEKARELARLQGARAMLAGYEAELVMGLADDTPDTLDPPAGHPGARTGSWAPAGELPGVSEFFLPELAAVLNAGRGSAGHLAHRAWVWRVKLPATHAALTAGTLDERRAAALADVLGTAAPAVARAVEAALLPEAGELSVGRLRRRALAQLLTRDAAAVEQRREQAERCADVRAYPSPLDGMATLAAEMPAEETAACYDTVDRLAAMLKRDGDPRPIGQLRTVVLADLIRRPWNTGLPGVTAQLQISATLDALAGASAEPGEVNGQPITAGHARELLARLDALGLRAPAGGSLTLALTDPDGTLRATVDRRQLERVARRGCPSHPGQACGCPVLDRPPATDAYEPTDGQRIWIKTRDRTCRFPHCGQPVGWADLDHVLAHARGGATDCANLCCLCRSHHRLKTFARGWRFVMDPDGTLHVTTPSGITRTTRPPGLRRRPAPPAPPPAAPPPDDEPPF